MSEKPLPSFRPIAMPLDADDAALDRINEQLGVPTLKKPDASARPERTTRAAVSTPTAASAPERAPLEKMTLEVPVYLGDALRLAAVNQRASVRHVVMLALQKAGFEIAKADLVRDGRRSRPQAR
jgi:hypothetical protein